MDLKKFLAKHAVELANIATVLEMVVKAAPIDRQDRERLTDLVGTVAQGASNIAAAVAADKAPRTTAKAAPDLTTRSVAAAAAVPPAARKPPARKKAPAKAAK